MTRPWCLSDVFASSALLLVDDFLCLLSFVASHPLHFAYLIFFSPYILRALSFLSPLLLSTSLLLSISPHFKDPPPPPPPPPNGSPPAASSPGLFGNTLRVLLDALKAAGLPDGEPTIHPFEPLSSIVSELQACVDSVEAMYMEEEKEEDATMGKSKEEEEEIGAFHSDGCFGWELETIGKLYKALTYEVEEFPIKLADVVVGFESQDRRKMPTGMAGGGGGDLPLPPEYASDFGIESRNGRQMPTHRAGVELSSGENAPKKAQSKNRPPSDPKSSSARDPTGRGLARAWSAGDGRVKLSPSESLSSSGSMRKDREWKRTLACKLYEERETATAVDGGDEGMDLLWEAYEDLGSSKTENNKNKNSSCSSNNKKSKTKEAMKEEIVEEEEEDDEMVGRLCCLQALRLRPNLLDISKAFKGMGMFRRGRSRRSNNRKR